MKRCAKNGKRYWKESKKPQVEKLAASKLSIPILMLDEFRKLYSVCVELNNHVGVSNKTLSIQVRNKFHPRRPNPKIPEQRYTKPKHKHNLQTTISCETVVLGAPLREKNNPVLLKDCAR